MAKAKTNLVIVESPAKAKTIGKYLGAGFKVTASMGHLRDLPKSQLGVDVEHGFAPDYKPVKGREETISELRKAAETSDIVYLATDPDREGEAISWHLKELLKLEDERAYRITFNEITKKVVQESIEHPRAIDIDLVNAQQARRILDRIVGYKLSPLLWRKIKRGLSAGRVQSVATRMVTDREESIRAFVPEEYWLLKADISRTVKPGRFREDFYGKDDKKMELHSEADVDRIIAAVTSAPFAVDAVKRAEKKRSPSPPFITSTLQQEASRKLGMTPRRRCRLHSSCTRASTSRGRHRRPHHLYEDRLSAHFRRGARRREDIHPEAVRRALLSRQPDALQDKIRRRTPRGHPARRVYDARQRQRQRYERPVQAL
jgi:DNA topoisomerase-1